MEEAMICQACEFGNPVAEGRQIWKPIGSGEALRWHRMDCCEGCWWFAVSNGIKQDRIDAQTGKKWSRWERQFLCGPAANPHYEWVEK